MTSVEKRRSGRKSGGHRKHSDGGYSDTSSSGSFLDETDREVSNLTDRAFRSLCIGDEAVYNDSDLCSSSPCTQRDKQLAFGQSGQNREHREREELKRAAHDSFSHLRVQQYEQDWAHGGMSGAEIYRDPHWEIHGEMTQGRVSATFQHSFVETAQREQSLREGQLSFLSNGATEFSSQQHRSRSRVSSLIRTFNSESQRDGAWTDGKLRERYNDNSWDKTALMNIQRELSEFSNSYQQNFNSDHFPTADPFSSRDTNFYSSHVAAVARVNSAPSFMGASHTKHSMSTQFNCNSNFFIHSELSPFKVWRDHNRFPFQQEQVSGFSHNSEIPKWYETPMYKELSQETQPQGLYRFKERDIGHSRNNLPPVVPPSPPCSTSTTTVLQKALAVEKRCESELMGHYTHRKRTQSLGTNRLPTQRPSTASPTTEMSRRVQQTISSVKALQQKIKKMTEQNMAAGMTANQHQALCSEDDLISLGQNAVTWAPNVVRSNTAPLNVSQLLTPSGHTHQEASVVQQCTASPEPVEHPPVRAESRGATPDIRMSSYRSRATSLLFNLKDNRKRVKNTYSPTKFKNIEMLEKTRQLSAQEPRDTVIDIPDFPDPDMQFRQAASHQYVKQYQNPGLSFATQNPCPKTAHVDQYSAYSLGDYQAAEKQAEMVPHSRFTGFTPENYTASQLANGQNPHEVLLSTLSSYQYGMTDNVESLRGGVYGLNTSYTATDTPKHTVNNQTSDYFRGNANAEQYFNETVEREFTKVERYQQPKDNKHDYSNVFSQDRWRNEQDTEKLVSPWKQEINALIERDQHAQAYQKAAIIKEEHNLTRNKYRGKNLNLNKDVAKLDFEHSFVMGTSHKSTGSINPDISKQLIQCPPVINNDAVENKTYYGQQPETIKDKYVLQKYDGKNDKKETKESPLTQNYNRYTDQDCRNQHALSSNKDKTMIAQETGQIKQYMPVPEGHKMQGLQQIQAAPQFEHNVEKNPLSRLENAAPPTIATQVKDRQFAEVKAEQATTEHLKAQHTQAELAKAQHKAQVEQTKAESTRLILAAQTGSEEVKVEQARAEPSECEKVKLRQAEPIIDKKRNEEQTEPSKEKHQEQARKEETKVKTENPRDITDGAGAKHMKKEQGEHVNAEQAEVDKLKEEHIKTELNKTGQVRIQTAQAKGEVINVEKVEGKQVRVEQMEVENTKPNRTENTEAEQVEKEQRKDNNPNHGQIEEQTSKTAQLTMKEDEVEKFEVDQIKIEDVRVKPKEDSNQAGHVNKKQPTAQLSTIKEAKTEEKTNTGRANPKLPKTEDPHEKLVKPGPNIRVIQQVKSEPDKVEQVKTELAKAKAELAKIKEKMRGEQKEKVKHSTTTDDIAKKDDPLKVNLNKPEDFEKKDQVTQTHQKRRDSLVTNYDNLREKNDFTSAVSANRNKMARDESSNDSNQTPSLSLVGTETRNNNKSNDKNSPKSGFSTADTENKEEVITLKGNDVTEGHYVYSESSKEFKLFSSSYSPRNVDNKDNRDSVTGIEKNGNVEELEKFETVKNTDISQQRNSDLRKHDPLERKHRSTDHNSVSGKDLHFTPPRALSQKERAQTKQEILTSKIKAHAEKEISAIKEKGLRDGFISKNSTKQLAASQSVNIRQRPPIQEVSKKYESTLSSNNTPKYQLEPLRIHSETIKSVSPASSATTPVMSAPTTGQSEDSSQKQVPKVPLKSNDNVLVSPRNTKQTGCSTTITKLAENQDKKNQSGVQSPVQSKDQAINDNQVKQESNHEANSGKQKEERVKDNYATSGDHHNEKKNLTEATALVKVTTTEKPEIKHEDIPKGSAPTLNLVLHDQNTTGMADDSLQIMGIMVTVRERKPLEKHGEGDNSQECVNTKKKEGSNSELDKCHHSSGQVSKEKESSTEGSTAKTNNSLVQEMYPTEKEDQIMPETLNERQNNALESVTEKNTNLQESSSVNTRYKRETQLQKQMTERGVPAIVTAPAKNKVLAETQPRLYGQGIIEGSMNDSSNKMTKENSTKAEEETNPQKTQTAHNQFTDKVDNAGTHFKMDSGRTDDEPSIKHDVQLSLSKEMSTFISPSKSGNIDGKSAPLLDEKRHDSTQLWSFNEAPPPHSSNENHKRCGSPKLQFKETFTGKNVDGVHIDSIAIRVVSKKDKQDIAGKHCVTVVPFDVVKATEFNEVAPSRHEEKANTSNNNDRIKDLIPANSDRQVKDNLGVQHVLANVRKLSDSLRNSMQHNNINGNGKPETVKEMEKSVDESKIKAMEGDYFQVQGAAETHDELHNSANNGETLDDVSKGGGLPGSKTPVSNKPYKELQYEAFVLDPLIKKTLESSQIRVQDENMEKKNWETEGKPASKQTDTPTERQNSSEKTENGKHLIVSPSSLSARESQSSRNSDQTRDNAVTEKTGVKPKLKSSTIPEISAIADYARLKVIVSEEQESTIQEFPPNKKEGFFPLIQTRHSRRPVFTLDPKEFPVKDKKMPNKTEMSAKMNKEPKALVFPITEKEHQRTGMFKLGDKERQEKMISDTQGILDAGAKYTQCPKERMKSPTTLRKYHGCEEQVAGIDAQRLFQVDQSSPWSDNPDLQTISSSVAVNRPRNTSASQHPKSPVNFNAHEKQYKDDNRSPRKGEMFDEKLVERREERKEKPNQEGLANQYEETVAKQSQKEQASIIEEEKRAEEIRKKRIIKESRASLAEEERRTAQREEERRAKEREAIALRIKERREKQRESDKMKENKAAAKEEELRAKLRAEEIKVKETERTKAEEDRRAKLRREEEHIKENEERRRLKQQEEETASQGKQQQRAAQEEQLRRAAQEEQLKRAAQEEHLRRTAQEEQLKRTAQEEQMRRATQEEQLRRAALEKQKLAAHEEQHRRAAQEEQHRRAAQEEQQRRATQEEQQIRVAQEEQHRRAAQEEQQRRATQEKQQIRVAQEEQQRAAQEEQQKQALKEEQQRRAERIAAHEEQQRRAAQKEQQQREEQEEQQMRAAHKEQQGRAAQEEQQRRSAQEEQQKRAAQEEQQRRYAQEEQQKRAAHEEQQRRAAQKEQQQREEQEEQQMRAAHKEQQGRAAQEEQQRRSAQEEQQKRAAQEEQQRRYAQEEQQRRAAQEEQQRRAAYEEQQRRAALEEQRRRTVLRKQKIATEEEQQRRAAREEQQRRDAQEELQIRTAQQEQQRRVTHEEQQRRVAKEEQQRRATLEEQQRNIVLIEEETQIKQTKKKILDEIGKEKKGAQEGKENREAVEKEKTAAKQKVEKKAKEERTIQLVDIKDGGESQGVREWLTQKEDEIKAKMSEEDEKFATQRYIERGTQMEEQRRAAQMMDALQYYAITSSESERKTKERQVCSPFPSQQKHNPPESESTEDSGTYTRHYRPHGSASPPPRSNTSSPALGAKPSMFRVKDNTIRGSSLTKPVKPRFHKNFGEDFRVGSPIERVSERGEEEKEITKHGVETRINRLAAIKEFSTSQQESSSQDYSSYQPQHRPYSRRSIALDEDDSRSVISNMSEGVESFATSATDLADVRGLYDYGRPESACSYSSDVSRSMGKPPAVPPKSDKAMQRAKRLTTRRIKKELFKAGEDKHAGVEKPPQELSRNPPSSSNEVHYSNRHTVASPHFSSPISLAHAPISMHTSHTEHKSSHHSVQASPHATGASSLPITSPHVTASVTLPVASSNPTSPASNNAVFKTVPHVSSSPTLHHATHPAPVTQYHVESSYPQSYPFTQRKVLQDLSSGQYFVVDVPVQVKTKTFFDPETGKYVQLNVRESGQSTSQPQPQQTYPQPQLQSQVRVKSEHPQSQASPAGKPIMLYQGYHGYPQGYHPAAINSMPPHGSSTTLSLHQNQQPVRENHSYRYPTSEVRENSEGHCYSPEKTPYMDTVNDTEKTYNTIYNTHGSYEVFPECDTNSQLAGSSVCENDSSAHTRYQPRDIITMGELEDFMEVSDW